MHRLIRAAALVVGTCCAFGADAQSSQQLIDDFRRASVDGITSYGVDIDNDSLLLNKNDGFYTSRAGIFQHFTLHDADSTTIFGWRLRQELYTASDINLQPSQISRNDHPYVGWLYGGVFKELHRIDGSHLNYGLDIGCLGPCAGGEVAQKSVHRLLDQPQPQAWSTQLKNEWGAVLYADVAPVRWSFGNALDLTPTFGGRFGNIHTDVNAGLTLRVGQLNQLPDQQTFHGFVRVNGRAVGYDATLQGGYFSDDDRRTVNPRRLVGEAEAGLVWRGDQYGVYASIIRRSNEIDGLSESEGAQNFVRLQFVYTP